MSSSSSTSANDADEFLSLISEQRRELAMARDLESDFDFAFRLQMQEALTASVALQPSSSAHHPPSNAAASTASNIDGEDSTFAALQSQELDRFEQERRDREQSETEMKKWKTNLERLIHDQKVASEIERIPEDEWEDCGADFERPYGEGCSENSEPFRLYFKGLVSEERVRNSKEVLTGLGVAVCDPRDNPIIELQKPLVGNGLSRQCAELKALIEGLNAALALDLKRITFFCDYYPLFQFVIGKWPPKQRKISTLVHQVSLLRRKFIYCSPSLVARNDIKFAFKLARDAIVSQITKPAESGSARNLNETCVICLEDTNVGQMFAVDGCLHRYCFSCMKQHVEVKLLHGMVPICPHENCKSELNIESCGKFLTPKLIDIMKQRIKEASIPVTEKVYCPYPRCSALMSRNEVLEYATNAFVGADRSGARKCTKCHGLFCINCKVPWHSNMTCNDYKQLNPFPRAEDAKLKSLATKNLWRQCVKCNHMIELIEGCFHMTCRCGYEFCYTCGAQWVDKKATCSCPLWEEDYIIHHDDIDDDDDDDDEGFDEDNDGYYYDSDSEDFYW
ncbi:E3 ubiquitin-protein ligase RSL1-like [Malania oleifera]|uniref:E3 ubiquitin-protein ligase RSL1-like n=1 Tax=Malania oleifera TaxID=397392 RepID=UPI0025AE9D41|nr:E3 ubiquitin-protein ligase RSL1-like [Malania oleifera]